MWTLDCKNAAENSALEVTLKGMDSEVFAVESPDCPDQNGVWFWVGKFTPEQIESIKTEAHVVKSVESNIPVKSDFRTDSTGDSLDPAQFQKDLTAAPLVEEFSLQRRASDPERTVSVSKIVNPSLSFLSTAPGKKPLNRYTSFKPAYNNIKIYLLEFGVNTLYGAMSHLIEDVIYVRHDKSTPEGDFQGTCAIELIGGGRTGAARNLIDTRTRRITLVKIDNQLWCYLAGIAAVYHDLQIRNAVSGYNVVIIPIGINMKNIRTESTGRTPNESLSRFKALIKGMIKKWQVVFVVAAVGTEKDTERSLGMETIETYPALWANQLPIVVVGAVDIFTGDVPAWAYDGPEITVRGPGQGYCIDKKVVGTSVASAYVGGLVAYFLSLPDVGAYLRRQGNVPSALIEYLQRLAYSRSPSNTRALAVWNGLDASLGTAKYSFWIGDPNQDIEIGKKTKSPPTPPAP